MRYTILSILIFIVALQGCKNGDKTTAIIPIDLTGKPTGIPLDLNEQVTDLKMIRLETHANSFIRQFWGYVGEQFIINIDQNKVILFSSEGKYIQTITQNGNGPQEFIQIDAWAVDENENHFLFHDMNKNYIYNFNLNSRQFEVNIPFEAYGNLSNMVFINDTTLSILPGMFSEYGYLFFNQTLTGKITGGVVKENVPHPGVWAGKTPMFKQSANNSIVYQASEADTLFNIAGTEIEPVYALHFEEPIKSGDKTTGTFISYLYANEDRILFSKTGYESIITTNSSSMRTLGQEYLSYDLNTLETSSVNPLSINNIDLSLANANVSFPKANQIVFTYQAFEFKQMIDETIQNKDLTDSEKVSLEKLNQDILENDNPIIITGKLK